MVAVALAFQFPDAVESLICGGEFTSLPLPSWCAMQTEAGSTLLTAVEAPLPGTDAFEHVCSSHETK